MKSIEGCGLIIRSSNCPLRYLPKGNENICPCEDLYLMLIEALFITAKNKTKTNKEKSEKQSKCPSTSEWINSLQYIYLIEHYL